MICWATQNFQIRTAKLKFCSQLYNIAFYNHPTWRAIAIIRLLGTKFINEKEDSICTVITENRLDLLEVTETVCTSVSLGLIHPPGYWVIGLLSDEQNCRLRMNREPFHRLQRKPLS